jgi:hypothetical protein
MRRVIIGLARTYPLTSLATLLSVSTQVAAGWLQLTRQVGSYTDPRGSAVVLALEGFGLVLLLPMLSTLPLRHAAPTAQAHDDAPAPPPLLLRIAQLPIKWRIVGYVAWGTLFFLALARLVTAISGDIDRSDALRWAVAMLNVGGMFLVVAVRTSLPA